MHIKTILSAAFLATVATNVYAVDTVVPARTNTTAPAVVHEQPAPVRDTTANPAYHNQKQAESTPVARPFNDSFTTNEDKQLLDKIREELKNGWFTKGYEQVAVSVDNGHVTLAGSVDSQADKEKVEKIVRDTKGVKSVNSQLQALEAKDQGNKAKNEFSQDRAVTATDKQLNKKIRDTVSLGYFWNSYETVKLDTNNGSVVLEGTVDNAKDEAKLIDEIRKIEGVKAVESRLTIKNR